MDIGARVWIHEPTDPLVWVAAQILAVHRTTPEAQPSAVTVELTLPSRQIDIPLIVTGSEYRNVLLQNPEHDLDQNDLVSLPHLHEASILHSLRLRYARDAIYTRIGEILISINPFKKLPTLYTREAVTQYGPDVETPSSPHLFAIARAAYVDVVRNGRNQSILISGESGAGKTEATKIMMKYFAETCGGAAAATTTTCSIETQVLQSNPILEAFGNARTVRNDNSSRFGKFIELQFDTTARHAIVGARIRTYLLEKIRVIGQAPHERNFHVFYELVAAAASSSPAIAAAAPAWRLGVASDYCILNQSGCYHRRDGVDDATQFARTHRAMQQIGLRDDEIIDVFSVVAAFLHLGNVTFVERVQSGATPEAVVAAGNEPFVTAAALLRVSPEELGFAMTKRTLVTATETLTVSLDVAHGEQTRNALVMEGYRLLFAWLVSKINAQIHYASPGRIDCIGLLDIFGFEDMAVNSFEQLCINYANEALQHQFNGFVFDEEQKLYEREGIAWAFVDFPNNQACLELFEKRPLGLFSLADQECLFPQGTDRALLAKLYTAFDKKDAAHPHFVPPAAGWQRQSHFVVAHYAGRVSYAVDGFLAKNKDAFCATAAALLATSRSSLVQSLSLAAEAVSTKTIKSALATVSVGTQFKLQLSELLDRIRATAPHYVRCIKPNDTSAKDTFRAPRVLEQLRCGGVLEAVRVARAGFPVRMTHAQFLERYARVLLFRTSVTNAPRLEGCLARLAKLVPCATTNVSLGRSLVFFRREPYEHVERLRSETTTLVATILQKIVRGYTARSAFRRLRRAVLRLQSLCRGASARVVVTFLRQTHAATRVQCHIRQWLVSQRYMRIRASILACQTHFRRRVASRMVQQLREARAALRIGTFWRCHVARRQYTRLQRATVAMQCAIRRRDAKKRLLALRAESRNVSKLQQDNLKLQTELATLRMALLTMQAQAGGQTPFTNIQIPIEPALASKLQMPKPSMLLRSLGEHEKSEVTDNQPDEPTEPEWTGVTSLKKPRSQLTVDLSNDTNVNAVKLQAPQSVLPPKAPAFQRRGSGDAGVSSSTTKAELFTRRRSRSTQLIARNSWQNQQDALDAKVKQLREELKEAARAADPEEEQHQIVKRFVAAQIQQAALATPRRRLSSRHSGSFDLDLPEDCDNNSMVDEDESFADDGSASRRPATLVSDPTATMASPAHFKKRSSSGSLAPPLTACAPQSRFHWGTSEPQVMAPLSARPASHTGLSMTRCFFGDPAEASAWSPSVYSSTVPSIGSIPRWCKSDQCYACHCKFTFLVRRHHCRCCGNSFCFEHSSRRLLVPELGYADAQRVCDDCFEMRVIEASRTSYAFGSTPRPMDFVRPASVFSLASTARDSDVTA